MRRVWSEVRWAASKRPSQVRVLERESIPSEEDSLLLLDGGRWLLAMFDRDDDWGCVYPYDLDEKGRSPHCIIDLGTDNCRGPHWMMAADLVVGSHDQSSLEFNLCLTPYYPSLAPELSDNLDWPARSVHFYRLIVVGNSQNSDLEAHKIKSLHDLRPPSSEMLLYHFVLRGDYLVRSLDLPDETGEGVFYRLEVYNWVLSNDSEHYSAHINGNQPEDYDAEPVLIPAAKMICFLPNDISVYDLSKLQPNPIDAAQIPILKPYWSFTGLTFTMQSHLSRACCEPFASRVTAILDDSVVGFTIPHDIHQHPSYRQLSECTFPDELFYCMGISKIYYYVDPVEGGHGSVKTIGLSWDEAEADSRVSGRFLDLPVERLSRRRFERPLRPWDSDIPPLFDESSNRILTFSKKYWLLLDFNAPNRE
ncbi:hypothetical protein BDN70DRAFT_251190 [Pholiota conissans]|uniref:Uncharacterized protein n=1 Tax=Pholiota conissans TaxID=109636 RepID=A0A9P5YUL5_9AGAR|nr:hypothetical protein BDN70DRAFT_251190 [Pholiota conissans]